MYCGFLSINNDHNMVLIEWLEGMILPNSTFNFIPALLLDELYLELHIGYFGAVLW